MDFLEVRVLNSSGIVSSRLGASKDGADEVVYVLHGSSRAHNTVSRRELSLSNVVRHVIQGRSRRCSGGGGGGGGGFRIIRAILGGFVAVGTEYSIFSYVHKYENDPACANNATLSQRRD